MELNYAKKKQLVLLFFIYFVAVVIAPLSYSVYNFLFALSSMEE